MTERQRNFWLRACTEAKAFVILHKSELKKFKSLAQTLKYIEISKVNDLATYIKHHPLSDVCDVVKFVALLQTDDGADYSDEEKIKQLSDLNTIRGKFEAAQIKTASKNKIDDVNPINEEGDLSNDTDAN